MMKNRSTPSSERLPGDDLTKLGEPIERAMKQQEEKRPSKHREEESKSLYALSGSEFGSLQ
jgi:hypothetical protein